MRIFDERRNAGPLDDLDPAVRALLEKVSKTKDDECSVKLRDDTALFPYTNRAYLYVNFYPENEDELKSWFGSNYWCYLFIKPDEDNPGHWQIFTLDPQMFCSVELMDLFCPQF